MLKLNAREHLDVSGNTSRCIENAIWTKGRPADPAEYVGILDACGASTCASIVSFLKVFGGIELRIPDCRSERVIDLCFGVWPGLRDVVRRDAGVFSRVNDVVGCQTAQIGDMDGETFYLYMDEIDRIFQVYDTDLWYVGVAGLHALENLCMRAKIPKFQQSKMSYSFIPPGCPNARWLAGNAMVQLGEIIGNDPIISPQATPAEFASPADGEWICHRPTLEDVERAGVHVHPAARRFLDKYSGIRIVHRNPHLSHYVSWGYLGLCRLSLCDGTPDQQAWLQGRRERWGWPVIVGMIDDFNRELVVTERGEVMVASLHGPDWLLGRSPDEAIDTLLNQKPWKSIRR